MAGKKKEDSGDLLPCPGGCISGIHGIKPWSWYQITGWSTRRIKIFSVQSNEDPVCPVCGGRLKKKDWVKRINVQIGGEKKWLLIERRKCTKEGCGKTHRLLPDISLPYKHYDAGVIEDVIDGTINEEALSEEAFPSESTLYRWRRWSGQLLKDLEGFIRSAAYRILELSEEFLSSGRSLLEELKERINYGWLSAAVRICINAGGG